MARVQNYRPTADGMLANSIMSIAESRSVESLGMACEDAIGTLSGSSTVGLYLLDRAQPCLIYSHRTPEGFLADYERGLGKSDDFVESILDGGGVVDGYSFYGEREWRRSISYDLLHSWGFSHNMCGPLRSEDRVVGVFYTATAQQETPYTALMRQQMDMLCRAASLALTSLMRSGRLETSADVPRASGLPMTVGLAAHPSRTQLPPRSAKVAELVCRGMTNKMIARQMGISDQTVKEHVTNLRRRFGARNRTELATLLAGSVCLQ